MRTLMLVKHSLPRIDPARPARQWPLAAEGRRRCVSLAERLAPYAPAALVASVEPKASETAALVAARLGMAWETAEGLHEHDRSNVGFLGEEEWQAAIARFFARPDELVLGRETATQARQRFARAVAEVLERTGEGNVAIVAHGTVIALYVAARAGVEPLPLWQRLGLPSFVALSLPDHRLLATVDAVGERSPLSGRR